MANCSKYTAAVILAGALQASVAQAQLNNVIDCAQYPATEASERAEKYLPDCRSWAQPKGYADAVVLPIDTAANEVELASQPLTCPTLKEGNVGYQCRKHRNDIGDFKQQIALFKHDSTSVVSTLFITKPIPPPSYGPVVS